MGGNQSERLLQPVDGQDAACYEQPGVANVGVQFEQVATVEDGDVRVARRPGALVDRLEQGPAVGVGAPQALAQVGAVDFLEHPGCLEDGVVA